MKTSLSWLKEHLDTQATVGEISEKLGSLGLVVDGITNAGEKLSEFIIAEIVEASPHPNADRLRVCKVNTGNTICQVVCGAPNARAGLKGVFAPVGSTIPASGMVLKPTRIRDVESSGMMCSYAELGIESPDQGTIIELDAHAPVGEKYAAYAGLDEPVLDIDVTPNRGDCFAVRGIARDLAAAGLGKLKAQELATVEGHFPSPVRVESQLTNEAKKLCPAFTGRIIKDVKNRPSPEWLQKKLRSVGIRPISALVDITNFMSWDLARLMHVFDVDKLQGNLVVRLAENGERIRALDDKEYTLDDTMTIIADERGPVSIAGIMGGKDTGCSDTTTSVFLESALFNRINIALTGRKLGIYSDSRARFERGVDATLVKPALEMATRMILDICGGEASEIVEIESLPQTPNQLSFQPSLVETLGGLAVPLEETRAILSHLGFEFTAGSAMNSLNVQVPPWRHDIEIPQDLVEEILRIKGYDTIPAVFLPHSILNPDFESTGGSRAKRRREWIARRILAAQGYCEALTWSFTREDLAQEFGGVNPALKLDNPISQDLSVMRPSLLPNLLLAIGKNLDRGQSAPAFFEVGAQFQDETPKGQKSMVTAVRSGHNRMRHWQHENSDVSIFTVKNDVLETLAAYGIDTDNIQIETANLPSWYHPGRAGWLQMGPKVKLGLFGELHPGLLKTFDLKGPLSAFEIFLENIPPGKKDIRKAPLQLSNYQPVERDLAFIVDKELPVAKVLQVIHKTDRKLIKSVQVFDVYQGRSIDVDKKSIAFAIRMEPSEKTLTEAEIAGLMNQIIENVKQQTGGELRS